MIDPAMEKLSQEIQVYPDQATRIIVHNNETLRGANDFLLTIKSMRKKIGETFNPIIEKAHRTHREALDKKKEFEQPLIKAEGAVKLQIASYMREQERKRREAEEKAREEERKRLAVQEEARRLEATGQTEEAERIREEIPETKPAILPDIPTMNNVQIKKIVKWEVSDFNQVPTEYLMIDSTKVGAAVRASKGTINIPGIRIYFEDSVAARV